MNWTTPATESSPGATGRAEGHTLSPDTKLLHVTRTSFSAEGSGSDTEVFRLSLGEESIMLLPLRTWGQLDIHKWVVRGKLPASPAGLEITPDHVKVAGETVSIKDPDGCVKLEKILSEWLAMEKQTLELNRKKTTAKPAAAQKVDSVAAEPQPLHYQVEVDKGGQVHIKCIQRKEILVVIGLNASGFKSLVSQGFLRKPRAIQIGALHDWLELDGIFFSFEKGNNDAAKLEKALNEHYVPPVSVGQGKDVVVYSNAASSTGFDLQFPVSVGGMTDNRRRPLNEDTLELLQDPTKCGLLHKGIVIKIARPTLIFKQKTPDGGERYLESCPENMVIVTDEDGKETSIDLGHPVNFHHLSTAELTAVFNHPSLHKHSRVAPKPGPAPNSPLPAAPIPGAVVVPGPTAPIPSAAPAPVLPAAPPPPPAPPRTLETLSLPAVATIPAQTGAPPRSPQSMDAPAASETAPNPPTPFAGQALDNLRSAAAANSQPEPPVEPPASLPNAWLATALATPMVRHDWFACLVYGKIAEHFGNSNEGVLGLSRCWGIALGEAEGVSDPDFKGFFLTEKGGFGFLNQGHIVRFNKEVVFIGTQESAIEGIGVSLVAVGLDDQQAVHFVVTDHYRAKFGIPESTVAQELARLKQFGAELLSVSELLKSPEPLDLAWTVPAEPGTSGEPEVAEHLNPQAEALDAV